MGTLGPKYILFGHMDPLGHFTTTIMLIVTNCYIVLVPVVLRLLPINTNYSVVIIDVLVVIIFFVLSDYKPLDPKP